MNKLPYYGETITIYQSPLRWQLSGMHGVLLVLIPLALFCWACSKIWHDVFIIPILLMTCFILMRCIELWHNRGRPYLVVSSSGLEFYGHQYTIRTSWDNLKRVTPNYEILLHKPSMTEIFGIVPYDPQGEEACRIPLEMFHSDYDSQLFRQLRSRVPQVCPWRGTGGQS